MTVDTIATHPQSMQTEIAAVQARNANHEKEIASLQKRIDALQARLQKLPAQQKKDLDEHRAHHITRIEKLIAEEKWSYNAYIRLTAMIRKEIAAHIGFLRNVEHLIEGKLTIQGPPV